MDTAGAIFVVVSSGDYYNVAKNHRIEMPRPVYHKVLRPSPKVDKYLGKLEAQIMEYFWSVGQVPCARWSRRSAVGARLHTPP